MHNFEGKTVLITGATGLIGSNLVDKLMAMGNINVIAMGRSKEKLQKGFAKYIGNHNFKYILQDVCDPICLPDDIIVNYIFHAAGSMDRNAINTTPLDVIRANLVGLENCMVFLQKQKKVGTDGRIIVFSSITVYGNNSDSNKTVTEDDTDVAITLNDQYAAYAETKRMAEVMALAYHRQIGIDIVIARLGTVYGYTRFPPDTAFYSFMNKALLGQNIEIQNPTIAQRDNIYIDDAVTALLTVCEKGKSGEAYNISMAGQDDSFAAVDEMAVVIVRLVNEMNPEGSKVTVQYVSEPRKRQPGIILKNDKLRTLGWTPKNSLAEGIFKTLELYTRSEEGCC